MRVPFQLSILASAVVIAGCGGGGPSGSNVNSGTGYLRSSVSYATPLKINHFTPLTGTGINARVSNVFVEDLNNDSVDEVVVGGRQTQSSTAATWRNTNMQLYGWNTGSFTNETSTWFSGTDNEIVGTEPSIKFGDFNGDGNIDMFSAPSTDMSELYANAVVFHNSGSDSFNRSTIATTAGNSWTHDSWVGDLNGDGRDDIVMANIGGDHNLVVNYGNADGTFSTYYGTTPGGSGISVADYLGDGTMTIILTDTATAVQSDTKLFSFTTSGTDTLSLTEVATLPASYFYRSEFDDARTTAVNDPHEIRNFTMDFNNDGVQDVVVVSNLSGNDVKMSAMQFLRNDGAGFFTDVTDTVLVNYDYNKQASYQPVIIDINNDGLDDILLTNADDMTGGYHDGTRVLVQTRDGKFVQKYETVFKDFYNQIYNQTENALDWGQPINIVVGPSGEKYLFSTVLYEDSGNMKAHTYLAKIGTTGTISAQSAADVISATWPYLNDPEVNEVLAKTSPLTYNGTQVIDLQSALQPVGNLKVNNVYISGNLSISGLNNSAFKHITAIDDLGRNYDVDLTPLTNNFDSIVDSDTQIRPSGITALGDNITYNIGADSSKVLNSDWRFGLSVGKQQNNPWLNFDGMFGKVNSVQTVEFDVNREYSNGVWHRAGIIQWQTDFTPGLINRVDNLWAGYGVLGYKEDGFNLYGGLKPTLFSGSVGIRLPTNVDSKGKLMYTEHNVSVRNQALGFLGVNYKFMLDITKTLEYKLDAQIDSAGNKQGNFTAGLPW